MFRKDSGEPVWGQGELDLGRVPVGRAKTSALPENEPGLTGNGQGCGANTSEPFAHFDPNTSSWRTSQVCLLTNTWDVFSETWPRAGMMRSGIVYQLRPLVPRISVIGSGLWPTMRARLTGHLSPDRCADKFNNLESVLSRQLWPTPTKSDATGGPGCSGRDGGENLRTAVGGSLNPQWVEWLMGYPIGWTDLGDSATPSFLR